MATRTKTIDQPIGDLRSRLLVGGWKKHAHSVYRRFGDDRGTLVSANIHRSRPKGDLQARLELHRVDLNQISHIMWDRCGAHRASHVPRRLSPGKIFTDFRACNLFSTGVGDGARRGPRDRVRSDSGRSRGTPAPATSATASCAT